MPNCRFVITFPLKGDYRLTILIDYASLRNHHSPFRVPDIVAILARVRFDFTSQTNLV